MRPLDFALYGFVVIGWSSSWLPLKWQVGVIAPEVSLVWRFLLAGSLMVLLGLVTGRRLALPLWGHAYALGLGVFLFSTNFALFYYASQSLASGLLAVVFATASLLNLFYGAIVFRSPIRLLSLLASLMGFGGILLLYWPEIANSGAALGALGLCLCGTLSFCTGNMISAAAQRRDLPVIGSTAWGMFYGAGFMLLVSLFRGHALTLEFTWRYIGGGLWLAVFSSVLAFSAYLTLLGRVGAARAAYATVLFPPFALLISTLVEGYQWTGYSLLGLPLVLIGIIVINMRPEPRANQKIAPPAGAAKGE